jgi:hypothetical protein
MTKVGRRLRHSSQLIPKGQLRACWCMFGGFGHGSPHWALPSLGPSTDRTRSVVTVGRVSTARLLDMCGNHGQLFGSLRQAFHAESASL